METKKIIGIIFSILFVGAFAFCLTWGIINFNKVKEGMSGTGVYTQNDLNNAYEDGYNTAISDKEGFEKLIDSYRDTITTQSDQISQLNSDIAVLNSSNKDYKTQVSNLTAQRENLQTQVDTLNSVKSNNEATIAELNRQIDTLNNRVIALQGEKDQNATQIESLNSQIANLQSLNTQLQTTNELNLKTITGLNSQITSLTEQINDLNYQIQNNSSSVTALNNKIAELQKSVSYYEQYIASLESGEQVIATFEFAGSVYNIQVVNKNDIVTVTTPTSTAYVIFNGWTVNGEAVDLATYQITTNTKFVADVTYKYEVNFVVDEENYNNQIIVKNEKANVPADPTKAGYVFDGWTLDGKTVVDVANYSIAQNTNFVAKFSKLYSVIFKYEDTTISTQTIKNGNLANAVETTSTVYKVFNGWKVNNAIVDITTYKITADTVFVADITYKYDVKFMVEGAEYNAQLIEKNAYATLPETPVKTNYRFVGWTINGTDAVDVNNIAITENTTFTAMFVLDKLNVTFKNGETVIATQQVDNGGFATKPDYDSDTFMGWTLDGTNVIDITTCQINQDTTFIAKFGEWQLVFNDSVHSGSNVGDTSIEVYTPGVKAGDKVKFGCPNFKVMDGREFAGGGFNNWEGFVYSGEGNGNFEGNSEWTECGQYDDYGNEIYPEMGEFYLESGKPVTTCVGRVDWNEYNYMTFTVTVTRDNYITISWTSTVPFYVNEIMVWLVYAVR